MLVYENSRATELLRKQLIEHGYAVIDASTMPFYAEGELPPKDIHDMPYKSLYDICICKNTLCIVAFVLEDKQVVPETYHVYKPNTAIEDVVDELLKMYNSII